MDHFLVASLVAKYTDFSIASSVGNESLFLVYFLIFPLRFSIWLTLDTKIQKLEYKPGLIGYAIFWKIVEVLMQKNGRIENNPEMLAYQLKICDLEVLRATINDFELFDVSDAEITNKRVLKHLNEITAKSLKAQDNANKRWGNK